MPLTQKQIDNAGKHEGKKLADQHGLCLFITKTSKLWRWRYRFNGKPNEMSLGEYPFVTLEKAREIHHEKRKLLKSGVNPMAAKKVDAEEKKLVHEKAKLSENTFRKVATQWMDTQEKGKNENYWDDVRSRIERYAFSRFGDKPINEIKKGDIRDCIVAVNDAGFRELAGRMKNQIETIFDYAIEYDLMGDDNPASTIKLKTILPPKTVQHHQRVVDAELPNLLAAIDSYGGPIVRVALKLLPYLMIRPGPFADAPWEEFDLEYARWDIPEDRMKHHGAGRDGEMKYFPHIVPLSKQAVQLLRTLKTLGDGKFLFPNGGLSDSALGNALDRLRDRGLYKGKQTPNGFRGIASTVLRQHVGKPGCGFIKDHIEVQMAHLSGSDIERAYNWADYVPQRTDMMQWYADYLDRRRAEASKP